MKDNHKQKTNTNPRHKANANLLDSKSSKAPESAEKVKMQLTGKGKALIIGTVIICAAVVAYFALRDTTDIILDGDVPMGLMLTEANVRDMERAVEESVALGMFETHMNTTWRFPDGKSPSNNAVMGNSPNNNFSFWFTITLSTGQMVYESGLIPVGTELAELILDEELTDGRYDAVVQINMVQDDGTPVDNNMGINVVLVIGS